MTDDPKLAGAVEGGVVWAWNRFFHAQQPTLSLGLFRIVFASFLLLEVATTRQHSLFAMEGGFHLPYFSFIPQVSKDTYHLLHDLQYPFIVLLGVGLLTRISCGALLVLQGFVYFSDALNFRNHPYLFLLLLFLFLLSPGAEAVSLRSVIVWIRKKRPLASALIGPDRPVTIQRMMQLELCLIYFCSGLHKLHSYYLSGNVLSHLLGKDVRHWRPYLDFFFDPATAERLQAKLLTPQIQMIPSIGTVSLELTLPFLLWNRRTRPVAIFVGIVFHSSILLLMDIVTFSGVMMGSYLLFLNPVTLPRLARRVFGDVSESSKSSRRAAKQLRKRARKQKR